jgi:hypothetical protein
MKKFKIVIQTKLFGGNEIVTEENKLKEEIIEADNFIKNKLYDSVLVTEQNINSVKNINPSYKIGDMYHSSINSISFFISNEEVKNFNVLYDGYYKLYEFINDEWLLIDKHNH